MGQTPLPSGGPQRVRAMAAQQGIGTFGAVIDAYFSTGQGAGLKSKRDQLKRLRSVFATHLLCRPADVGTASPSNSRLTGTARRHLRRGLSHTSRRSYKWAARRAFVKGAFNLEKPHADTDEEGSRPARLDAR